MAASERCEQDMDDDFLIEVIAPEGHQVLRPHLGACPFDLAIEWSDSANSEVLVQRLVSPSTGFFFEERLGDAYLYGACGPDRDIEGFSAMLRAAGLTHRIDRIQHELDTDEEFVSFHANGSASSVWTFSGRL